MRIRERRRERFEKLNWTLTKEGTRCATMNCYVRLDVCKWSLSCVVIDSSRPCFTRIGQFPIAKDRHKTAHVFFHPSVSAILRTVRSCRSAFLCTFQTLEKRNVDRIVDSFRYSNRAPFLGNGWERNYFNKRNIIIKSFIPVIYYEWKEKMRHNLKWKMIYNEVYYTWSIVYRRIYIYIHMCHWFLLLFGRDWMSIYRIYLSRWWGMDVWMAKWVSLTRAICRLVYEIDVNYDWIRSWWMLRN